MESEEVEVALGIRDCVEDRSSGDLFSASELRLDGSILHIETGLLSTGVHYPKIALGSGSEKRDGSEGQGPLGSLKLLVFDWKALGIQLVDAGVLGSEAEGPIA